LNRLVPEGIDEDTALSKDVNKIRHILGCDWKKIGKYVGD